MDRLACIICRISLCGAAKNAKLFTVWQSKVKMILRHIKNGKIRNFHADHRMAAKYKPENGFLKLSK